MAGASQLGIYNKSLRHLEERKLLSLQENREPLRYLNDEWQDAVNFCLYQGYWNFSIRLQEIPADTTQGPNFGFEYSFAKPADWVRTFQIADNDHFMPLLRNYSDQNNVWYADISPIYVKFISNDPNFGLNMSLWTPGFVEYLAAYLARLLVPRIKQAESKIDRLDKVLKQARAAAKATDAMDLPPGQIPYGTWVMSRAPRGSILPYGSPFPGSVDD